MRFSMLFLLLVCVCVGGCVRPAPNPSPTPQPDPMPQPSDGEIVSRLAAELRIAVPDAKASLLSEYATAYEAAAQLLRDNKRLTVMQVIQSLEQMPDLYAVEPLPEIETVTLGHLGEAQPTEDNRAVLAQRLSELAAAMASASTR